MVGIILLIEKDAEKAWSIRWFTDTGQTEARMFKYDNPLFP